MGVEWLINFLDDYFFLHRTESGCREGWLLFRALCAELNVGINLSKLWAPSTVLEFLAVELDTVQMEARLSIERIAEIRTELEWFTNKRTCTRRRLLSLIGLLSWAAAIITPGRIFLARLIRTSTTVKPLHHHVTLDVGFRADISWWRTFLTKWNGRSLFLFAHWSTSSDMLLQLATDASGEIGAGAIWGNKWFNFRWPEWCTKERYSIQWKELYVIVAAAATWGSQWTRRRILFECDNESMVKLIENGYSPVPVLASLMRTLHFISAEHSFLINATHIPGKKNLIADSLSRFKMQVFRQQAPEAEEKMTPVTHAWP
eukprot:Lithocolla_globosa_v1_NODE_493_length_3897_cov_316.316502.p2 type:complete len:317 gc:universal NODE_493_length_3897_cov_316.316502:1840-2790(+)